jgi:conjugative relaxase-like TrwC/TraI family protein
MHVVREGGYRYYVDDLVPGRAEGTLVAGEEPGMWWGGGSEALGVHGIVETEAFAQVLDGRDPVSGRSLRMHRGSRSVAAYDLTFAAPKSVSVLHALGPREIASEVGAGHQAAVKEATTYLDRRAVGVRRTRAGAVSLLPSTGSVAAHFLHRTSRTLDPHLHTHVVTANVAQGVDGTWSAVDSRRVFAHLQAAQGIYHARLRLELSDRIGAAWQVPSSGLGDVIGVDGTMRRLFSQRSAAMDEYRVHRVGASPGPSRSVAAYHATRPDKDRTCSVEALMEGWKARAAAFGLDVGDLTRVVGPRRRVRAGQEIDRHRVESGLNELARHNRSIAHRDMVAVVAAASPAGASARSIESFAGWITEASGRPIAPDRVDGSWSGGTGAIRTVPSAEPRWQVRDVIGAVERAPDQVLAGPTGGVEGAGVEGAADIRTLVDVGSTARADALTQRRTPHIAQQLGR